LNCKELAQDNQERSHGNGNLRSAASAPQLNSGAVRQTEGASTRKGWFSRTGLKLILSLFVLAVLTLHLARIVEVDATALGLVALVVLPWVATALETAELPGGWKLKFREVAAEQERLGLEVKWLQFLMRNFLTDFEVQHLQKFASDDPFWVEYDSPLKGYFERELRRMLDLNLIERLPNRGIRGLLFDPAGGQHVEGRVQKNVKDYMRITSHGREYLRMRAQMADS
jgi:hypothetical protein